MRANRLSALGFCVIVAGVLGGASTGGAAGKPDFIRIAPGDVQWHDSPGGHGVQEATLFGDPDKPGCMSFGSGFRRTLWIGRTGIRTTDL